VFTLLMVGGLPDVACAKGELVRIEVKGETLAASLAITDFEIVRKFFIWYGPGAGQAIGSEASLQPGSFLDWHEGIVVERPKGMKSYEVSFYCVFNRWREPGDRLTYVVRYEYDPSTQRGYIYLPGPNDKYYGLNVSAVVHGVEGHWFYSSSDWESLVGPLIHRGKQASGDDSSVMR